MELKLVTNTARSAVLELTESGKFYTESQYDIYVNDEKYMESNKVITSLFDLKPDTDYNVYAVYNGQKMPEYETIRAAVAGENGAVEKVVY